jgi:hypothetical protein
MTVLLDDDDHMHPTFLNITEAFKALSEESQPGDAVFVQSGTWWTHSVT